MTGLIDIFKESLPYPIQDIKTLLIFGVFFVVMELSDIFLGWGINLDPSIKSLLGVLAFIAALFVLGYFISVLRQTISGYDGLPEIDFKSNLLDGIQYIIVAIECNFIYPGSSSRTFERIGRWTCNHCNNICNHIYHICITAFYCRSKTC